MDLSASLYCFYFMIILPACMPVLCAYTAHRNQKEWGPLERGLQTVLLVGPKN